MDQAIQDVYVEPNTNCVEFTRKMFTHQYVDWYYTINALGTKTKGFTVQFVDEDILLYTWSNKEASEQMIEKVALFEEPIIKHQGQYGEILDLLGRIHDKLYKFKLTFICKYILFTNI